MTETLKVFERELAAIHVDARSAREAWRLEADQVERWKEARQSAEAEGDAFFVEQAIWCQRSQELLASERRLELEEWEQLVADYSAVIEMLKERLAG